MKVLTTGITELPRAERNCLILVFKGFEIANLSPYYGQFDKIIVKIASIKTQRMTTFET